MKNKLKILKFKIKDIIFGINLIYVKEVGKITDFFYIPSPVNYFEGLFNLRGNILPLINLGKKANLEYPYSSGKENVFILINDTQYQFGIFVDKILGINILKENDINNTSYSETKSEIIENIINIDGEVILLINVKSIIEPEDFKFKNKLIFKTVDEFKKDEETHQEIKEKISYAIFQLSDYYFAIEAKYINQLLEPQAAKISKINFDSLIAGEIEFENKIIPLLNLAQLTGIKVNLSKNLNDYYIAIIESNNKTISLLVYFTTEFVEIYKDNILKNEDLLLNQNFITECFKLNNKLIKIIDVNKLLESLLSKKALKNAI